MTLQLLTSSIPPISKFCSLFSEKFFDLLVKSDYVHMATGFISADSIVELKKIVEDNRNPKIDVTVGMHYFEGVTHSQHEALSFLNDSLSKNEAGFVNIVNSFKFHGKIYNFFKDSSPIGCIIGSSNLSNISNSHNSFETDLFFDDPASLCKVSDLLNSLKNKASISFDKWQNVKFIENNELLEDLDGVLKVTPNELERIKKNLGLKKFNVPIKASDKHTKSNLNVFFGKGREDKRGLIIPRPWYEVELIVPKEITSQEGYPDKDIPFKVYTDDGWTFECSVNGDFKKNFRSSKDLSILGKWIKGRLENTCVLKLGELVTENTLKNYGRNNFELISTNKPNEWFINFGRSKYDE